MKSTATKIITEAITEHGTPNWIAYVPTRVRKELEYAELLLLLENAKPSEGSEKRVDKTAKILRWCADNLYEQVTVKQIASIGSVSVATAKTLMTDRADIFRPSEGKLYEIRDPQADRGRKVAQRVA